MAVDGRIVWSPGIPETEMRIAMVDDPYENDSVG
jgi:hypothetical protein